MFTKRRGGGYRNRENFKTAISFRIGSLDLYSRLIRICQISGRQSQACTLLNHLLRFRDVPLDFLRLLADREKEAALPEQLSEIIPDQTNPDPLMLLGMACANLATGDREAARRRLEIVVARRPDLLAAQSRLGTLLLDESPDEFAVWCQSVTEDISGLADFWILRGVAAERSRNLQGAARCYWEAVRIDAARHSACYRLGALLRLLDHSDAAVMLGWAQKVRQLVEASGSLQDQPQSIELMLEAAAATESLGRLSEARAWRRLVASMRHIETNQQNLSAIESRIGALPTELADHGNNPATLIDASNWKVPAWPPSRLLPSVMPSETGSQFGGVRFEDQASIAGIDFRYVNGSEAGKPATLMIEFTGGGVAILDYDGDDFPDVYFTQGGAWPPVPGQQESLDQLYRNIDGEYFFQGTRQFLPADDSFSQGVSAGDFNSDGFPDLYVANIGVNRLFFRSHCRCESKFGRGVDNQLHDQ
jgi:tetratricopeptide (TPR) repeat protein